MPDNETKIVMTDVELKGLIKKTIDETIAVEKEKNEKLVQAKLEEEFKKKNPFGANAFVNKYQKDNQDGTTFAKLVCVYARSKTEQLNPVDVAQKYLDDPATRHESYERIRDLFKEKAQLLTSTTSGGILVPYDIMQEILPLYTNASIFDKAGVQKWTIKHGTAKINKELTHPTTYWGVEMEDAIGSDMTYGDKTLNAKKATTQVVISNNLLRIPDVNIENNVRNGIISSMALAADSAYLRGSGYSSYPMGLKYQISSDAKANSAGTTQANITADITKLLEYVDGQNIPIERGCFVMSSRSKNYLLSVLTTNGNYVWRDEVQSGQFFGHKLLVSNAVPNNISSTYSEVYFFDAAKCVVGEQMAMTIEMIPNGSYKDSAGTVHIGTSEDSSVIQARMEVDFALLYDRAGAMLQQVGWGA